MKLDTSNMATDGQENDNALIWLNLSTNDRELCQERCENFLNWFLDLKPELLVGMAARYVNEEPSSDVAWVPDTNTKEAIHNKYKDERVLCLTDDCKLNIGQLVVALGVHILETENSDNVDFAPLCSIIFLDETAYTTCKLVIMRNGCDPCYLIESMMCDVPAVIVALVMANCELSFYPLQLDWKDVVYSPTNLNIDDLDGIDDIVSKYMSDSPMCSGIFLDSDKQRVNCEMVAAHNIHAVDKLKPLLNSDVLLDVRWEEARNQYADRDVKLAQLEPEQLKIRHFEDNLDVAQKELEMTVSFLDCIRSEVDSIEGEKVNLGDLENFEVHDWCLMTTHSYQSGSFKIAKVVRDVSNENRRMYDLSVLGKHSVFETIYNVPTSSIACLKYHMCQDFLRKTGYFGLRVVALSARLNKTPSWRSGTIGAPPNCNHGYEYLVFFDNGIDRYVQAPSMFKTELFVEASQLHISSDSSLADVVSYIERWKLFPLASQSLGFESESHMVLNRRAVHSLVFKRHVSEFLKRYFVDYPEYRMVSMKKPKVNIESNKMHAQLVTFMDSFRKQRKCHIVDVDRALAVLRPLDSNHLNSAGERCLAYPCSDHDHEDDELIFRGSTHLMDAVVPDSRSNMSNRRSKQINKQYEVIDPTNNEVDLTVEQRTARKSTMPPKKLTGSSQMGTKLLPKLSAAQISEAKKMERMFTLKKHNIPEMGCLEYHTNCSSSCLKGLDRDPLSSQFSGKSPLIVPIHCGWYRKTLTFGSSNAVGRGRNYKAKTLEKIVYIAPCGQTLSTLSSVANYIALTKSDLTIDLFCFDAAIDIFLYAETPSKDLVIKDYAQQCEHWPIPAVNSINREPLPDVVYCARRFPYDNRVDVRTIDKGFCSGCSCTDDCSDPSVCECQKLTSENVRRLAKNIQPKTYGYRYRNLAGQTSTGVFECNDNCSCNKRKCFNRVAQNPILYPIQLFKTAACGWGVRTLCDIPKGAFISNYVGAILTDSITDELGYGEDAYFADLDLNDVVEQEKQAEFNIEGHLDVGYSSCDESSDRESDFFDSDDSDPNQSASNRNRQHQSQKKSKKTSKKPICEEDRSVPSSSEEIFKWSDYFPNSTDLFVIDAKNKGNIGRFLNHSCDPNVHVQHVLVDTHDLRLPWCSFFALKNIKAGEELCWNYHYHLVNEDDGRPEELQLICQCGAAQCQGRLL